MSKDTLNLRIDGDLKKSAELVLDDIGLSMTAAVTLFLKAVVRTNGIPFTLSAGQKTSFQPDAVVPPKLGQEVIAVSQTAKSRNPVVNTKTDEAKIKGTTSFKNAIDKL